MSNDRLQVSFTWENLNPQLKTRNNKSKNYWDKKKSTLLKFLLGKRDLNTIYKAKLYPSTQIRGKTIQQIFLFEIYSQMSYVIIRNFTNIELTKIHDNLANIVSHIHLCLNFIFPSITIEIVFQFRLTIQMQRIQGDTENSNKSS